MSSMGSPGSYFWLAALVLLLAFTVITAEETATTDDDDGPPVHMFPLTKRDLEHAFGLQKRSDEIDLGSLSLADKHEIFFGGFANNGQIVLANMTLNAPKGQRMVLMEHFDELTSDRICNEDTGHLILTFKSKAAYKHALESWSHVKGDSNEQFIMMTNHDGCGPQYERQPYIITDIDHHEDRLETRLTARSASFQDTFDTYDVQVGKALSTKHFAHKLFKRFVESPGDIISGTKGALSEALEVARKEAANAVNNVFGDVDATETFRFDFNMGEPDEIRNIFMDMLHKPSRIIINCLSCYIRGAFEMTGNFRIENGEVKDISFDFMPKNFRLKFDIETRLIFVRVLWNGIVESTIANTQGLENIIKATILPDRHIPRARIYIPKVFELSLKYGWSAQVVPLFIGVFNGTAGVDVSLPDTTKWTFGWPRDPTSTGFEGAEVNTHFNIRQADGICKVVLSNTPKIMLELDLFKTGRLLTTVALAYPEYGLDISPRLDKNGACEKELGAGTAGASLNGVLDITINIITATYWRNKPLEITDWRVYFDRKPLPQLCYAFPDERFEVGDSPQWLTETGFDTEEDGLPTEFNWDEDGLPAEFTSATREGQANENADEREFAFSGSSAAASRLRSRSLDSFRLGRTRRLSREIID